MIEFLGSIWWLLVTLGLLVTFHEFGHFWVARRLGVRVLRFSVGFGRPLWKRIGADDTEYVIAAIPLGGYVKMLDAREQEVEAADQDREFSSKPVWKRIAIVVAGPAFNLVFAVAAFWLMFMVGKPDYAPVVGQPAGIAAKAGFAEGDRILSMDGETVATWTAALNLLADGILRHNPVTVEVRGEDGTIRSLELPLDTLPDGVEVGAAFEKLGLRLQGPPARVGSLTPGDPAEAAGMQAGDRILAINGHPVENFGDLSPLITEQAARSPTLSLRVERDGQVRDVLLKAVPRDPGDGWVIGIRPPRPEAATLRYGPLAALGAALENTWDKTASSFAMIGAMLSGEASTRNLSGVITIARVANTSADLGFAWFLGFLGLVSLSLGVLNLLPIPLLDGGHLLYYFIEIIKGSPVSEQTMIAGQYVGMAVLVALMGLALYNDILRLVP